MSHADNGYEGNDDLAPGDEVPGGTGHHGIRVYLLGLLLASLLTVASFAVAGSGLIWGPGIPAALLALAVAQMGVHLVFFLHITSGPENTNNVLALAFGVLIVLLVVGGSMWIMAHLDTRVMPMSEIMKRMH